VATAKRVERWVRILLLKIWGFLFTLYSRTRADVYLVSLEEFEYITVCCFRVTVEIRGHFRTMTGVRYVQSSEESDLLDAAVRYSLEAATPIVHNLWGKTALPQGITVYFHKDDKIIPAILRTVKQQRGFR